MKCARSITVVAFLFLFVSVGYGQVDSKTSSSELPSLPTQTEGSPSLGFAGMVGGAIDDVLIAAGGANFPDGLPWKAGKKVYSDKIYILKDDYWRLSKERLPSPLAYGASVSIPEGVLIMGGEDGTSTSDKVFLLRYNSSEDIIEITDYPPLPEPLAYSTSVLEDDFVYVVGGKNSEKSVNSLYRMSLKDKSNWEKLNDFPGTPRALHAAAVQETKDSRKLFVIGGRNQITGKKSETLTDYLSYDLNEGIWENEGEITINGKSRVLMGASAEAMGSMHLIIYGGSDEVLFDQLEHIGLELAPNVPSQISSDH